MLYSKVLFEVLLVVGAVALIGGRLRRRLRVHPEQSSRAPVLWLVNVTADARLHRRLRNLAGRAREVARGGRRHRRRLGTTPTQRLAIDLAYEVVNLDERLVESRALDHDPQMTVIREIRADADRIEALVDRVDALVRREAEDPSATLVADPIGAIAVRLEELEVAGTEDAARVIDVAATPAWPPALDSTATPTATEVAS